ncbi:histidine phosphatase family protein [Morganella morganii subsp. sibonii]
MDNRFLKSVFRKSGISRMTHSVQTLVFLRHGEKPDNDSGQLTGKGLNRALALADLLISRYGRADALYAAAPKQSKLGNSLRSLQTITPVAIRLSLPVHLEFHAKETKALRDALLDKAHHRHTVFVVWEHDNLVKKILPVLSANDEALNNRAIAVGKTAYLIFIIFPFIEINSNNLQLHF